MLPPQSPTDVDPIERELRLLDDRLRIVWNPRAFLACPGSFDAQGNAIPPRYDGRWQVILLNGDPTPPIIYTVAEDGQKAYRPVGPGLVTFMRLWDAQNVHRAREIARMEADAERAEAAALLTHRDTVLDQLDRHAAHWSGRELFPGFTPPTTA